MSQTLGAAPAPPALEPPGAPPAPAAPKQAHTPGHAVADGPCRNCGTPLAGHYCGACGQHATAPNPTLHDVLHDAVHEFLHVDGKIFTTLKLLCFRPGELTAEYARGRRARYVPPLRLYLTMSVLFFALVAAGGSRDRAPAPRDEARIEEAARAKEARAATLDEKAQAATGSAAGAYRFLARTLRGQAALDRGPGFAGLMKSSAPKAMFLLVPVFALLLRLAYRRRPLNYPLHLYFAIHFHAFVFLALALRAAAKFTTLRPVNVAAAWVLLGGVPIYLLVALHRVYGGRPLVTAARAALVVSLYVSALMLAAGVGYTLMAAMRA